MPDTMPVVTLKELQLGKDERAAVIGQTGTGKSTLCKQLIPRSGNVAIVDPKRDFEVPGMPVFHSVKALLLKKPKRFIFRPSEDDLGSHSVLNEVFKYCYNTGNFFIYIDDAVGIIQRLTYPKYLQVCYQMGRSKNIAMLACFQRPSALPLFMTSEAQKYYVFRLSLKDDVKRVSEYCLGYKETKLNDRHTFAFYDACSSKMEQCVPVKLKLK